MMTRLRTIFLGVMTGLFVNTVYAMPLPFINEIHYENVGDDVNEFVEIAGVTGTNLTGWSLLFYNGYNRKRYNTYTFTATDIIANQSNGFGTLGVLVSGIQNGENDGIALVNAASTVIQFLSYEGTLTASNEAASGITSQDIGVSESALTATTGSLQLVGSGNDYDDFHWVALNTNTFGQVNSGQTFLASLASNSIPEPNTLSLFALGLLAFSLGGMRTFHRQ